MTGPIDRREFLRLASLGGGCVFASGLGALARAQTRAASEADFFFVQLSDTHWGYEGAANPDAQGTLPKAIAAINAMAVAPDFVVFTGDLTHLTPDDGLRRERLRQFKAQVSGLNIKDVRFLPGEHDASLDHGAAYREIIGATHYAFDHKGVHFIALDNVSDPRGAIGDAQLAWLADDLSTLSKDTRLVVLAHRPLFDLAPEWGWATADAARVIELLTPFSQVTVFYGHIHQAHHHQTGAIAHHAARSLIFPLPPPGSSDHKPLAWDPDHPYRGLGWRRIASDTAQKAAGVQDIDLSGLGVSDALQR